MRLLKGLLLTAIVFYCSTTVFAEKIVLKSGKTIEGTILDKTDKYVKVDFQGVTLTFAFDEIQTIAGKPLLPQIKEVEDPSIKGPQDEKERLIEQILPPQKVKEILLDIQSSFPDSQFYEEILTVFRDNYDEGKLQKILEWQNSELGKKFVALQKPYLALGAADEMLNPFNVLSLITLSDRRKDLLNKIREIQGQTGLDTQEVILKQKYDSINEVLPDDQKIELSFLDDAIRGRMKLWDEAVDLSQLSFLADLYESFSDDELEQFVNFLESEPVTWFNDCWQKGYLKALNTAVKEERAHNDLEAELSKGLKDSLILPDSQVWYVNYYYLTKETDKVIPILQAIIADQNMRQNPAQMTQLKHFFATIIHEQKEIQKSIVDLESSYNGDDKDFIQGIVQESNDFKPAVLDSVNGINNAWAEFYATGNEKILKNILTLFDLPNNPSNNELTHAAELSLDINTLKNLRLRDILMKLAPDLDRSIQGKIKRVVSMVDSFTDIAGMFQNRAYNYKHLNNTDEAQKEYVLALEFCADYSIVYNMMANIFEEKNEEDKSIAYIEAAVYLSPDYYDGQYNLGRKYFFKGLYDKAIKYYLMALKYNPKDPSYYHAIARAYEQKGDVLNAVKYFTKYLQFEPNGEFSALVRNYLVSVGSPFKEDETDPFVMLKSERYDDLEGYLEEVLEVKKKDEGGNSVLYNVYNRLTSPAGLKFEEVLPLLEKWVGQKPDSHFANVLLGRFYVNYAWAARGTGYANTVVDEGQNLFQDRLLKAKDYLEKAYDLNPNDPLGPSRIIGVAMGLGLDRSEMEKQFQRAIKADPSEYQEYAVKLQYLMPKWYGSKDEMFDFARESSKNAPPHSLVPKVLLDAHWEMNWQTKDGTYLKNPAVWDEMKSTYNRLLNDFPNANSLRNWYAFGAYLAGDYGLANEQFAIIKDNWDESCWGNFEYFEKVKKAVSSLEAVK